MTGPKVPTHRPMTIRDVTPRRVEDFLPNTPRARVGIGIARIQAKANALNRIHAAVWQQEQDRFAERREAAAERRRSGR